MKKSKANFYKIICIATSVVFIYSFSQHLFNSDSFLIGLGLQSSDATDFLAHRLSIFPIGLAILLFLVRNLSHTKVRQSVCISMGFLLLGYAFIGTYELIVENVNKYVIVPVFLEIILGVSFLIIFLINKKYKSD